MAGMLAFTVADIASARATATADVAIAALIEATYGVTKATNRLVGQAARADRSVVGPEIARLPFLALALRAAADLIDAEIAACGPALREVA